MSLPVVRSRSQVPRPGDFDGETQALFARREAVFGGSLHGSVLEHQHDAVNLAVAVLDRRAAVFDRETRAIASDEQRVIRKPHDDAFAQHADDGALDGLFRFFGDDVEDFIEPPRAGGFRRPARELGGDGVQILHAAPIVCRDDGIADAAQGGGEPFFALAHLARGAFLRADDQRHQQGGEQGADAGHEHRGSSRVLGIAQTGFEEPFFFVVHDARLCAHRFHALVAFELHAQRFGSIALGAAGLRVDLHGAFERREPDGA